MTLGVFFFSGVENEARLSPPPRDHSSARGVFFLLLGGRRFFFFFFGVLLFLECCSLQLLFLRIVYAEDRTSNLM
jgi:hypothetical protein